MQFKGKNIVVSGGSTGIGFACIKAFLGYGAEKVSTFSCNETRVNKLNSIDNRLLASPVDLTKLDEIKHFYEQLPFDRVDTLVVNAGISKPSFLHSIQEEDLREVIDVNLIGAYYTIKYALPKMKVGSNIVFIGSISATLGQGGFSIYCATKAGIVSLTKTLAAELQEAGIRVNCVSPGMVSTPILDKLGLSENDKQAFASSLAPKRAADANEIAEAVAFLASDKASYINATNLIVDGGTCGIFAGKPSTETETSPA